MGCDAGVHKRRRSGAPRCLAHCPGCTHIGLHSTPLHLLEKEHGIPELAGLHACKQACTFGWARNDSDDRRPMQLGPYGNRKACDCRDDWQAQPALCSRRPSHATVPGSISQAQLTRLQHKLVWPHAVERHFVHHIPNQVCPAGKACQHASVPVGCPPKPLQPGKTWRNVLYDLKTGGARLKGGENCAYAAVRSSRDSGSTRGGQLCALQAERTACGVTAQTPFSGNPVVSGARLWVRPACRHVVDGPHIVALAPARRCRRRRCCPAPPATMPRLLALSVLHQRPAH